MKERGEVPFVTHRIFPLLPSPSFSSRVSSGSWDRDLKIVVGPVYASSAKRLINAAGTENQFLKAEINNNN